MIFAQNFLLKAMNTANGLVLRLMSGYKARLALALYPAKDCFYILWPGYKAGQSLTYACGLAGSVPPCICYEPMMPDPMMELMKLKLAPTMELVCFLSEGNCSPSPLSSSTLTTEKKRRLLHRVILAQQQTYLIG